MADQKPIDIYTRVSKLTDEKVLSTDGQEAECRATLAERGLPVGEVFCDPGISAWDQRKTRPDWERMMERLEGGISGGCIMFDLERFARQPDDGERLIRAADHGLKVLDSESQYDLTQPNGKRQFRDMMNGAAWYSDNLQRKVKRGKRLKAARGEVDARRSFGFIDGVTQVPAERDAIRDHAARLLAGETVDSLMAELHEQGLFTITGAEWCHTTYRNMMTRPRNNGRIVQAGAVVDGVRLPGEPILDDDTFERVVAFFSGRKWGRPPSGRYLLTGVAYCGLCGHLMSGRPTKSGRKQYWCRHCHRVMVSAGHLDDFIADWAVSELADPARAQAAEQADAELAARRTALELERDRLRAVIRESAGRLGRGEIELDEHDAACQPARKRVKAIAAEIAGLKAEAPPLPQGQRTIPRDDARYLAVLADWTDATRDSRRAMVARALGGRSIVISPATRRGPGFDESRVTVE